VTSYQTAIKYRSIFTICELFYDEEHLYLENEVRDHSRSLEWHHSIDHIDFLMVFHSNYGPILYRYRDKATYLLNIVIFFIPTLLHNNHLGRAVTNIFAIFCYKPTRWRIDSAKVFCFHTAQGHYWRTNRRTDGKAILKFEIICCRPVANIFFFFCYFWARSLDYQVVHIDSVESSLFSHILRALQTYKQTDRRKAILRFYITWI